MAIEADLRTFLLADATVSGLVGTRVYPTRLPQGVTFPAVRYQAISSRREVTMAGPDGLPALRLQFDAYALTYSQARSLADALRERLEGIRQTVGATVVQGVFFETEAADFEAEAGVSGADRIRQDFTVWFEES